ncbi:MAG: STAS domain-containing protein [Gaiellaceae bacterium]
MASVHGMEPEFDVRMAEVGNNGFVVSVSGEVDLHTAPEMERELTEVLQLGGNSVVVDLAEVGFIDSTVLGLLLRYKPRFRSRGGDLVLVSDDRRILRTLEITGLDRIFRIEQRLGDAVAGLQVA